MEAISDFPLAGRRILQALLIGGGVLLSVWYAPAEMGALVTGIREQSVGALYAVNVVFFAGASAAAIIIGAIAAAWRDPRLRPLVRTAEAVAVTAFVVAVLFLGLGFVQRTAGRTDRADAGLPSVWTITLFALYLGNALALAYVTRGRRFGVRGLDDLPILRGMGIVLLPAAALLAAVPAWILGIEHAEPGTSMLADAALLYVSTILSGFALVVLAVVGGGIAPALRVEEADVQRVALVLSLVLGMLGLCFVAETAAMLDASGPAEHHLFGEIVVGPYAWGFWFAEIGGVIVPFVLLLRPARARRRIAVAAVLVVAGTLVERWTLIVPPLLGHAHRFYTAGGYDPGTFEIVASVAVYALGLLLWRPLARTLSAAR